MIVTAAPSPTGHPAYSDTLRRVPQSAAGARRLVRTALFAWALDELADDAALVVSELVANSVRHTSCDYVRVTVTRLGPGLVRVAVVDKSRKFPVRCGPGDDEAGGRGLAVVDWLSARWGTDPLPWGKRVWAELRRGGAGEAAEAVR